MVARDINKYRSLNLLFESAVATLRWSWVNGNGHFITNGLLRENFFFSSSDTKSDLITARCPLRFPPKHATLRLTWIDGNGPFITNSVLRENPFSSFDTESDLVTATMFNLENLNANNPEAYQGVAWRRGQIPKVPGSYIESLVRRVNRSKLRFEIGVPSTWSSIRRSQDLAHEVKHARGSSTFLEVGQTHNVTHFVSSPSQKVHH